MEQLAEGTALPEAAKAGLYPAPVDPTAPLVLFDCGGFSSPDSHFPDLRAQTYLEVLTALGAAGAVISASDLTLTAEDAQAAFAGPPVPLASCNLVVDLKGVTLAPLLRPCPGWYVIGLSAYEALPGTVPPGWWELRDPVACVQSVLSELPADSHVIISAVGQPPEVVGQLAVLPVSAVIGEAGDAAGPGGAPVLPPPVARVTELSLAQFSSSQLQPQTWGIELVEDFADDESVLELLAAEQAAARERLGLAKKMRKDGWKENKFTMGGEYLPVEKPVYDYVGADACAACHPDAYQAWLKSRHAAALASLAADGEHETLDCLECHTTALLMDGGYDPLEPRGAVGAVSCEACHGPGRSHAEQMQDGNGSSSAGDVGAGLEIKRGSVLDCLGCHDTFNSPEFDAESYWGMIEH